MRFVCCPPVGTTARVAAISEAAQEFTAGTTGVGVADADGANDSTGVRNVPEVDDDFVRGRKVNVGRWNLDPRVGGDVGVLIRDLVVPDDPGFTEDTTVLEVANGCTGDSTVPEGSGNLSEGKPAPNVTDGFIGGNPVPEGGGDLSESITVV
jgi:hypothetical protein